MPQRLGWAIRLAPQVSGLLFCAKPLATSRMCLTHKPTDCRRWDLLAICSAITRRQRRQQRCDEHRAHGKQARQQAGGQHQCQNDRQRAPGDRRAAGHQLRCNRQQWPWRCPPIIRCPAAPRSRRAPILPASRRESRKPATEASSLRRSSTLRNCTAARPHVPNSSPKPAQALKREQVSVLHGQQAGQPLVGGLRGETLIA